MTNRKLVSSIGTLTLAVTVSSAAAGFSLSASGPKLTSTLDGKSVLPHKIRWAAHPPRSLSRPKVEFRIDGKLRWVETKVPYVYGDDHGSLVTTWLSPGKHTFTVRAVPKKGRPLTRTTTARVLPAPLPPAELVGTTWKRVLSKQGSDGSPKGTWTIRVTNAGWKIDDPMGGTNFIDAIYSSPNLITLGDGIWTSPRSFHEGNGWCQDTNSPVRYEWSVSGSGLTLQPSGASHCGDQAEIVGGAWQRT